MWDRLTAADIEHALLVQYLYAGYSLPTGDFKVEIKDPKTGNTIKDHDKRIGACVDCGHYLRSGEDPVKCVLELRDRVFREPLARTLTWPFVPHVTLAEEAPPSGWVFG